MLYDLMKIYNNKAYKGNDSIWSKSNRKEKALLLITLLLMFVGTGLILIVDYYNVKRQLLYWGIAFLGVALFLLFKTIRLSEKRIISDNLISDKERIGILISILKDNLCITEVSQLDKLIELYEERIQESISDSKRIYKAYATIITPISAIVAWSFNNLSLLGISINELISLILIVLMMVGVVLGVYKLEQIIGDVNGEYKRMLEALKIARIMFENDSALEGYSASS